MKLVVHELTDSGVEQTLTPERNTIVESVRPHLYRHNFPTGGLKLEIRDESDSLVGESETVDISDIGTQDFFHGYVRFLVNAGLKANQTYTFKLVGADGYSFSESAYIGWCNGYDLGKYPAAYDVESHVQAPLDIEIWERKAR